MNRVILFITELDKNTFTQTVKQMKENLLTIKDFAKKHGVSRQAVLYQIKIANINPVMKYGVILIPSKTKYKPRKKD